jgi:hypothetical protein
MIVVKKATGKFHFIMLNKSGGLARAFEGPCEIGHSNNQSTGFVRTHKKL